MRLRIWLLGWLLGGATACGGQSQTTRPVAEVEFESLEQTTYGGYGSSSPSDAPCLVGGEPTVLSLDAESGVLTWRSCDVASGGTVVLNEGQGVVDKDGMARVRQTLAQIHPRSGRCAFDGTSHYLDLVTDEGTERMVDALGNAACPGTGNERTFVDGIPDLYVLLQSLRTD